MEFVTFTEIADAFFLILFKDVYKRYMWAYFLIGAVCFAVLHTFKAIALYVIARREGFKNRWMAFIPFFSTYYIGVVSDKNKVFRMKAKSVALAAAIIEFLCVAMNIVYYVAQYIIFDGGYAVPDYATSQIGNEMFEYFYGEYTIQGLPDNLYAIGWIYAYFSNAFLYWLSLLSMLSNLFLLICFFQTYACKRYVLFSLLSILLSVSGVFMFAVRNNRGRNYGQYLRERQQIRYQQYQEYLRQNGGYNNPNNPNWQNGSNPYNGGSYYGGNTPPDPFDGMGGGGDNGSSSGSSSSGSDNDDPFGDF